MTPVRPTPLPNTAASSGAQRPDVARNAAQKAFFQAAMGAQAAPASAPQTAGPRPIHRVPTNLPADPPERILRPGSLLDIRV